jgi:hypothetical protein
MNEVSTCPETSWHSVKAMAKQAANFFMVIGVRNFDAAVKIPCPVKINYAIK